MPKRTERLFAHRRQTALLVSAALLAASGFGVLLTGATPTGAAYSNGKTAFVGGRSAARDANSWHWRRVPHDEAVFGGAGVQGMSSVAKGGPGFVAVGTEWSGDDADAAVWTSADGLRWRRVGHEETVFRGAGHQAMRAVAAGGPGLVAVGDDGSGGDEDAAVWTSADGLRWRRVPHDEAVFGGADVEVMSSVAKGGPGLVAVGYDGSAVDADAAVWTSADGLRWRRVPHDEAVFGGADVQRMSSVAKGGPGLVAVGYDGSGGDADAAVWASADGLRWRRVPHDEAVLGGAGEQGMSSVAAGGPGLVAVGDDGDAAVWIAERPTLSARALAEKYAPLVYLHPDEKYVPMDASAFVAHSALRWWHGPPGCRYHELAEPGFVNAAWLGEGHYSHPTASLLCRHQEGSVYTSADHTRPHDGDRAPGLPRDEGFYLDLDDRCRSGLLLEGRCLTADEGVFAGAPVYYDAAPGLFITYWFFYGYSGAVAKIPVHEGDWEHITVVLNKNNEPQAVYYYQHFCPRFVVERSDARWREIFSGTHPIVYSARASHASYPWPGPRAFEGCLTGKFDPHVSGGRLWTTSARLLPVREQPWYGFGGAWGPVRGAANTGPLGPKYQRRL